MSDYVQPVYDVGGAGEANIPHPSEYNEFVGVKGSNVVTSTGTLNWQTLLSVIPTQRRFSMRWLGITDANKDTLQTIIIGLATSTKSVTMPTGETYIVALDGDASEVQFEAYRAAGGTLRFDAGPLVMREA